MESSGLHQMLLRLESLLHIRKHGTKEAQFKIHGDGGKQPPARIIYLKEKETLSITGPAKVIPMYS